MSQAKHILRFFFSVSTPSLLIPVKYSQYKGKEKEKVLEKMIHYPLSHIPINDVIQLGSLSLDTTEVKVVLHWNEFGLTDLKKKLLSM